MVKRLIVLFFVVIALLIPVSAEVFTVDYGSFTSSFLNIFRDVAEGLTGESYVAWRNGDNDFAMYIGDTLTETNGTFTGEAGRIVSLSTVRWTDASGSSYTTYTDYYVREIDSFTLRTNNVLVYSSLDDYPALKQGGEEFEFSLLFIISIVCIAAVIIRIFSWRRL